MDYEEICRNLNQYKPVVTLGDIFHFKESDVTRWLAYLLNPEINGLGLEPLNKMLECKNIPHLKCQEKDVLVKCEEVMKEKRNKKIDRIDLYIETPERVIGIENKLESKENSEQTERYYKSLKDRQKENQELTCIFLKPDYNFENPVNSEFKSGMMTYTELYQAWNKILYENDNHIILRQFMEFAEKSLLRKDALPPKYIPYADAFHEWLWDTFLRESNRKLKLWSFGRNQEESQNPKKDYWPIIRRGISDPKEVWSNHNFHFEISWKTECIFYAKKITIEAHLEPKAAARKAIYLRELRDAFEKEKFFCVKDSKCGLLKNEKETCCIMIPADFSSEQQALHTIQEIIGILQKGIFQECARIADNFCQKR